MADTNKRVQMVLRTDILDKCSKVQEVFGIDNRTNTVAKCIKIAYAIALFDEGEEITLVRKNGDKLKLVL
jgi:hypothetical protein